MLQTFRFHQQPEAEPVIQSRRFHQRRSHDIGGDAGCGGADIFDADGGVGLVVLAPRSLLLPTVITNRNPSGEDTVLQPPSLSCARQLPNHCQIAAGQR